MTVTSAAQRRYERTREIYCQQCEHSFRSYPRLRRHILARHPYSVRATLVRLDDIATRRAEVRT